MRTSITSVFASSFSRLHADILISRLRKAGVPIDLISILYPPHLRPNCTLCWLNGVSARSISSGRKILISGLLRYALGNHHHHGESLAQSLHLLGLPSAQSTALEERLLENEIVICVQAEDDRQLAAVLKLLEKNRAEKICVAATATTRAVAASQWSLSPLTAAGR